MAVFAQIMETLASEAAEQKTVMIDATYLQTHCTTSNLAVKKGRARPGDWANERRAKYEASSCGGRKGETAGVLHDGRPDQQLHGRCIPAAGSTTGGWLLADRGYDADWYREALKDKGISVRIPARKNRKKKIRHESRRYKRRNRIETMFGRLKDLRRIATRYDRCPTVFLSAIALASIVIFWL